LMRLKHLEVILSLFGTMKRSVGMVSGPAGRKFLNSHSH
jgi:hypothetical protein